MRGGFDARYVNSGHLIYAREGALYAIAFDLRRIETRGAPVQLFDDLATNNISGSAQFTSSESGILAYLSGRPQNVTYPVVWLNSSGKTGANAPFLAADIQLPPALSGRPLVAVAVGLNTSSDLFVADTARDTFTQLTFNAQSNRYPVWSRDGKHLVYASYANRVYTIWWTRSDGAGTPKKLLESDYTMMPVSFSPDGQRLAYNAIAPGTGGDLWTLPLDLADPDNPKPGAPQVFLATPKAESSPVFSPDGRWLAYVCGGIRPQRVYVRHSPAPAENG